MLTSIFFKWVGSTTNQKTIFLNINTHLPKKQISNMTLQSVFSAGFSPGREAQAALQVGEPSRRKKQNMAKQGKDDTWDGNWKSFKKSGESKGYKKPGRWTAGTWEFSPPGISENHLPNHHFQVRAVNLRGCKGYIPWNYPPPAQ